MLRQLSRAGVHGAALLVTLSLCSCKSLPNERPVSATAAASVEDVTPGPSTPGRTTPATAADSAGPAPVQITPPVPAWSPALQPGAVQPGATAPAQPVPAEHADFEEQLGASPKIRRIDYASQSPSAAGVPAQPTWVVPALQAPAPDVLSPDPLYPPQAQYPLPGPTGRGSLSDAEADIAKDAASQPSPMQQAVYNSTADSGRPAPAEPIGVARPTARNVAPVQLMTPATPDAPAASPQPAPIVPSPTNQPLTNQPLTNQPLTNQPPTPGPYAAPEEVILGPRYIAPIDGSQPPRLVLPEGYNPPAGAEYEWVPAEQCGCGPDKKHPFVAEDEFICDGGDVKARVSVGDDWSVHNIDMTDTVAHFDTLDGRTLVEHSNRVCIYAPRFAAVRQLSDPRLRESLKAAAGVDNPVEVKRELRNEVPGAMLQPLQPTGWLGAKAANSLDDRNRGLVRANVYAPRGLDNPLRPHENFEIIRRGVYVNTEKPRLHEHVDAALVWMTNESVEVMIEEKKAAVMQNSTRPQELVLYELDGKPRLRICKVASTGAAQPGDIVEFTLRFDNVGDQRIGNVTILDSLTTRLEYVEGSQQCSLKNEFFTSINEGDSLVLRWEVSDVLKVGEGGVIRFQCRVR